MCECCIKYPNSELFIIDNNSTYPPLLDWYKTCGYNLIQLNKNGKNRAAWDEKILEKYKNSFNYYVVSDSDLDLNNVPLDVLTILQNGLNKHKIYKAGLSIQIDDIPKNTITKGCAEYEKKYWLNSLDDHFYLAKVSTTFALYQFKEITKKWSLDAIRSKPPYTCKHIPWYITSNNITNEDIYYLKHLEYWTHWTTKIKSKLNL